MTQQSISIGSIDNAHLYDDADYGAAIRTGAPIEIGAPTNSNQALTTSYAASLVFERYDFALEGIATPTTIQGSFEKNSAGDVTSLRALVTYPSGLTLPIRPTGLLLMAAISQYPNFVNVEDLGTSLKIASIDILSSGTYQLRVGSTSSRLVLGSLADPLPPGMAGFFWLTLGDGIWRKAVRSTSTSVIVSPPFDVDPVIGEFVNWIEIPWGDIRAPHAKFACLFNAAQDAYEIIKWGELIQDGDAFYISDVVRAQEGTAQLVGTTCYYYPAPGAGTALFQIPTENFEEISTGIFEGVVDLNLTVPACNYIAVTGCVFYLDGATRYRSYIIPITDWAEV